MKPWLAAIALALVGCGGLGRFTTDEPTDPATDVDTEEPLDCPVDTCPDGCTDRLTDPFNCGRCGVTCVIPNAEPACEDGLCALAVCDRGWADCDGEVVNGCETEASCEDGLPCTTTCGSQGSIDCGDVCEPVCAAPEETCNAADDDCDGTCDEDLPDCRRSIYRSSGPLGHLYGHDPAEAEAAGQRVEVAEYFAVMQVEGGNTRALYRCDKGAGRRFMTTSERCEGLNKPPDLTIGYIAAAPLCGATPLYRMYSATASNHFYTTSATERDRAVGLGYRLESTVGYVWPVR